MNRPSSPQTVPCLRWAGPRISVAALRAGHARLEKAFDVKPIDICTHLGQETVDSYYATLSGKEIRAVLKAGGSHSNTPSTAFTQAARRKVWRRRFDGEVAKKNEKLALALLLEWLMRHNRDMLVTYLDALEVKHKFGETDEDFTNTKSPEELLEATEALWKAHPANHVATYLLLVGHLQDSPVYDRSEKVLTAVGMPEDQIAGYIADHEKNWQPTGEGGVADLG